MSELKQKILEGIRISGLQDWAFTVNDYDGIVDYERLTDEDIDELATYISDEINEQPTLNPNQQIVLDWMKEEHFDSYIKSVLSNLYFYINMTAIGDLENRKIQEMVNAYEKLSQEEFAQVLQTFTSWVQEQEKEEYDD